MVAIVAFTALVVQGAQTPVKLFKATAKLGVPCTIGEETFISGSKKKIDTGTLKILTIHSARLASIYPNILENISASSGEKLLIVRGSIQNPSTVVAPLGSSSFLGIRFWDGKGKGEFKYAGSYDPKSHDYLHTNLKRGDSAEFECVVRVPANFIGFKVGFYYQSKSKIAWYDFDPGLGKIASTFSSDGLTLADKAKTSTGQPFDFDIYKMKVLGVTEPTLIAGIAKGSEPLSVATVEVSNAMLLPARWGWQYVTAELVMKDGSVVSARNDLIDKATDKTWSGDLGVGASMTSQFIFRPPAGAVAAAFRLTLNSSKRVIEVAL